MQRRDYKLFSRKERRSGKTSRFSALGMWMRYLIIGNSAAGIGAAEAIRELDPEGEVTVVTQDGKTAYSRPLLPLFLVGEASEEEIAFRPDEFYRTNRVSLIAETEIDAVNPGEGTVQGSDEPASPGAGSTLPYDRLLLATGSRPVEPSLPGVELEGVFSLRTLSDARAIAESLRDAKRVLFVGGGFVCLTTVKVLHRAGFRLDLVITSPHVMSQSLDTEAAGIIGRRMVEAGIGVHAGSNVAAIEGNGRVREVALDDGRVLPADIVIVGKGVVPNIELARDSGIEVERGIIVDERMRASVPGIYAAGDVAEGPHLTKGARAIAPIWPVAYSQGRVAGKNMAGDEARYSGGMAMNAVDLFDIPCIAMGEAREDSNGVEVLTRSRPEVGTYQKLVFRDDRIVGAIFLGDLRLAGIVNGLMRRRADISELKDAILPVRRELVEDLEEWERTIE
jgi:NAD(P)H-nitrite reductase large subunit